MEITLKNTEYGYNPEKKTVTIDLYDIQEDVSFFARKYIQMIDESDCEECEECEELDAYSLNDDEIIEVLEERGYTVGGKEFGYPNNSIRINAAYEKLLQNIERVPIEKIEQLLEEHNIF